MSPVLGIPDEGKARRIGAQFLGEQVQSCVRFETGLRHWVYDVVLDSGRSVVVRLCHPDHRAELQGGVFWHGQLKKVGVPVASILEFDTEADQPYMILERLPGTDLGNVFDQLDDLQLVQIAGSVMDMQHRTARLRRGSAFGYALNYETSLRSSWLEVLQASIERSAERIGNPGVVDPRWVKVVQQRLDREATSFDDVTPTAFLHDATTKNVIVANGSVSGLVDVDEMGFGDPLWTVALTKMSLLSAGRSTAYVEMQLAASQNPRGPSDRLDLYTAIFGLDFLAELGQRFNQATPAAVDEDLHAHLETIMGSLV